MNKRIFFTFFLLISIIGFGYDVLKSNLDVFNNSISFIIESKSFSQKENKLAKLNIAILDPDTDGDGIPDYLDLDSDNDGILDADEGYKCFNAVSFDGNSFTNNTFTWVKNDATKPHNVKVDRSGSSSGFWVTNGIRGIEPGKTELVTFTFSQPVSNLHFSVLDLDSQEKVSINYYDKNGKRIPNLLDGNYIIDDSKRTSVAPIITSDNTYGLIIESLINSLQNSNANVVDIYSKETKISKIELIFTGPSNTPEYQILGYCLDTDTDRDGTPDHLDTDSDNDGCPDAIEGAGIITASRLDSNGRILGGVNSTGIPTAIGTGQGIGVAYDSSKSECIDTDGDGIPDYLDLDNDNDGILDIDEMLGSCVSNSIYSMYGYNGALYDNIETVDINSWNQFETEGVFPTSSYKQIATFEYFEFEKSKNAFDIVFTYEDTNYPNGFRSNNTRQLRNFSGTGLYSYTDNNDFAVEFNKVIKKGEEGTYNFTLYKGDNHVIIYKNNVEIFSQENVYGETNTKPITKNLQNITFAVGDVFRVILIEEGTHNTEIDLKATKIDGQCIKDTDGDGIPDYLDTDSDNDGCPDAIEGAGAITANQLDGNGRITGGVSASGIPTAIGAGQGVGNAYNLSKSDCIDTDGDGIPNYLDLDNDNDGILDIDEECFGFRAQESSGSWLGTTTSNVTVDYNGATTQTNNQTLNNKQVKFHINNSGGGRRLAKGGNISMTFTFSNPIKASEIAFYIEDLDGNITGGSPTGNYTFKLNNNEPNGILQAELINGNNTNFNANYNSSNGVYTFQPNTNDQYLLLRGYGNTLITSFTVTSTGVGTNDAVAYSLFAYKTCDTDNDGTPNYLDIDSDGDGCADALEGSEIITRFQIHSINLPASDPNYAYRGQIKVTYDGTTVASPNNIVSTSPNGLGVPQLVNNAGNNYHLTTNPSNLKGVSDSTDSTSDIGHTNVSGNNSSVQSDACLFCYKPASLEGTAIDTKIGISTIGKDSAWPENRKGAFLAIESKTKGLVIPRTVPSSIANPVLGMIIYDTAVNCLKMYTRNNLGVLGWYCMEKSSCDTPL